MIQIKFSLQFFNSKEDSTDNIFRYSQAKESTEVDEMDPGCICKIFILLWTIIVYADAANILVIIPLNSPSHFVMFNSLLKGLAIRGHNLDVISHFPQKKPVPGINDFSIAETANQLKNNLSVDRVEDLSLFRSLKFMADECGHQACVKMFETQILKDLRHSRKKYDLLITELFGTDCAYGFAHIFKIPVVLVGTSVMLPWGSDRISNPDNPSYIPTYFTTSTSRMTLMERLVNVYRLIVSKVAYYFWSTTPTNKLMKEFFGPDIPEIDELIADTSLILVNSHFSINNPRPAVPNFIEVGGLHIGKPKPVPKNLEDVIQKSKNGFIFLTMGSMVMTETFKVEKLQAMFDAFAELPFTVLWKANQTKFPKELRIPSNIHFETWMPQLDLLCHPKIKLFVSHGGLLGSQEAVHCGVPRIGIPLFADQELNIFQSVEMGIAIKVDYYGNFSKEAILEAAKEILYNDKYRENVKRISEIFRDRQNSPLDTAIYWIEYVIKHKGAPHLRSAGAELSWYQYYLIDVMLIVLFISIVIICALYIILINILCRVSRNEMKIKLS